MEHKRSRISARCKRCQAVVGRFDNLWLRITGSYYLPAARDAYHTPGLHVQGREKAASIGTALDGTLIRPLACLECADYLGFLCTKAPESKASFSRREFFKLPRMELRCDATNRLVQPVVDNDHRDMDSHPHHLHHQHPSPALASAPAHASAPASIAPSSSHQSPVPAHAQALYQKQPYPPIQSAKRPSPPPPSARSSPYSIPAATPSVNGYAHSNGVQHSSREHEVAMDAINRLQTQVQYNTAGLHTQRRDFEAVKDSVSRLSEDFHNVLESLRRELQARPIAAVPAAAPAPPAGSHLDDATLEVFASNLSTIATKANEIDALKMQLEIVKRRIKIMEDNGASAASAAAPSANIAPAPAPGLVPFAPSHEQAQAIHTVHQMHPAQLQHPSQPVQQYHSHTTPPIPRLGTPGRVDVRADARPPIQPLPSYHHTTSQEMAHAHETSTAPQASQPGQASGWVSVNPSVKRGHPNSIESSGEGRQEALGSPKRPKLAPLEPRVGQENATPIPYDRMQTEDGSFAVQQPVEAHYEQPSSTPSTFIQYSQSNDAAMEAYRAPASADKPKRGGRGGGRGRGRRSMPADGRELGTPEWDKPDWNGTRLSPEGYYSVTATQDSAKDHRGSTIVRRGSGGGPIAMRPIELARPGTSGGDPYAHTKKTRTKPVRNADGVLIRKDGRPDMRSQSSAANLRKVHARKEHERALEQRANTPTSGMASESMAHTSQGSQGSATPDPEAPPPTTQERHEQIMKQIFPRGVEESNRRNFHEQYFPPNSSPGTVPRVKPEMNTPSDRGDTSSEGSQAEIANGRSPTAELQRGDAMEVEQTSATAVAH
ncbi:uncharacterized protein K452DRAFT_294121 [Aplosporella prunicola CBS 121167]|uniref:Mis18 domain-containing protein n=1 Tax=Aplosporella prunicola CBS 121167 TaxID=1176127 RepID=A0A6A6BUS6_9PEZI|nr:uncharacterized protein K452DRAFT_294121 [Aplosporella prunicola CBS 121167]KAF2146557.1 hypothetical protein K452DRAFT_294121 [Aplosporella prunicola CBS 121167]